MKTRILMVLGAAATALAGCGSSPDRPVSASEACRQIHEATARYYARCMGGAVADWRTFVDYGYDCADYDAQVAAGEAAYQPAGLAACLSAYERACDQVTGCGPDILGGRVADGQPCSSQQVCGPLSLCWQVGDNVCGTVCARIAAEHQTCGLYCDAGSTPCFDILACEPGLSCIDSMCVKDRGVGESCGASNPVPCAYGLFCPTPAGAEGVTCQTRAASGPCALDSQCPSDQFCSQSVCTLRRSAGATCNDAPSGCAHWTRCGASGVCEPAGRPGTPCAPFPWSPEFTSYCVAGACVDDTVCEAIAGEGDSCLSSLCETGTSCDAQSLTCVSCGR